ncbi:MAG: phosphonate ABC transporter, permease protein PhnE [Burkholderiaceae bacterium]|jgi:phosphonate transport system permease protein|nr:phosphonate ABC transporter, permease protein PhnE [Burkholderiaceae bacterium]
MSVLPSAHDRSVGGERQVLLLSRYPTLFVPFYEKHWKALSGLALAALLFLYGVLTLGVSPSKIFFGLGELALMVMRMFPPDAKQFNIYLYAIAETLAIALLGTLSAAVVAFPLGFLAARNTTINRVVHFFARRSFDTLRGIDILIWALIWINVVGLGPFAGVLALFMSDLGIFGKLFSEAIEAADKKPVEGVLSTGGTHATSVRFGILPQVMPILLSQVLYAFESNTRSASIIGIVGAGGIGLILSEQIRTMELQQLSCVILMILVTVALIDFFCSKIRFAIIGKQAL